MGLVDFTEPFSALMNQGQVINQGKAMSKSLGNGVDLGSQLAEYGVDAVRLTIIGAGPPEDDIDWADVSPGSTLKWLGRVVRLATDVAGMTGDERSLEVDRAVAKTVDEVTRLIDTQRLNVAIARFHEVVSAMRRNADSDAPAAGSLRDGVRALAVMLSCYAPYTAEEVWSRLGHDVDAGDSVHDSSWPTADPALLVDESVTCVVQVAGKVRDKLEVPPSIGEDELQSLALASARVQESLAGREVRTVIVRAPKLVNVVPA
jgi:leucyl-tRNA synthetase